MTGSQSDSSDITKQLLTLRALVDGAYDIIEIWDAKTPEQIKWKKEWMALAIDNGAYPSP